MRASYHIAEDDFLHKDPLVIRDIGGPTSMSVTNDAEAVVEDLRSNGHLPPGRRLFYFDSEGALDEIVLENGRFAGFRPGPVAQ